MLENEDNQRWNNKQLPKPDQGSSIALQVVYIDILRCMENAAITFMSLWGALQIQVLCQILLI